MCSQETGKAMRTHQPCAACRMLRRRCDSGCMLAPYFPADDVENFVGVHRVFGASNVIKMIQMVEEAKRDDAVKAIVYEAKARMKDPVYGSAGAILQLQKMVEELNVQLESIRARVSEMQQQRDQLLSNIHMQAPYDLDPVYTINEPAPFSSGYGLSPVVDVDVDDAVAMAYAYDPVQFPVEGDYWVF
ncbi:hypothetical protein L6164_021246 [Bauhinia variegata]|uniref:Uncharacterized protein n=1 Tax=Bauhinia variegata TaxID=167791 RepID=A0ACB9MXL6_BAUVA|nr:hypothetical protein L6164_021246 [Bauhinia variegata]